MGEGNPDPRSAPNSRTVIGGGMWSGRETSGVRPITNYDIITNLMYNRNDAECFQSTEQRVSHVRHVEHVRTSQS